MTTLNRIGLDAQRSNDLAKELNDLLANYSVFYQNVRGYHWNVKGEKFFELHLKFEELYNDLFVKIVTGVIAIQGIKIPHQFIKVVQKDVATRVKYVMRCFFVGSWGWRHEHFTSVKVVPQSLRGKNLSLASI